MKTARTISENSFSFALREFSVAAQMFTLGEFFEIPYLASFAIRSTL